MFDGSDRRGVWRQAEQADLRDQQDTFLLSPDGSRIQFGYEAWGNAPVVFSALDRQFGGGTGGMTRCRTGDAGLSVTDWRYRTTPALNGNPLKLDPHEIARSLAVAPDGESFLLGADWWLRLFARSGALRWKAPLPGAAWAVNIANDGHMAAAALGDGTIRWYRMRDGQPLLAFFPNGDRKRWILWTPAGYYDCSPGAEELIGWHVNNGRDAAADFHPASRFRAAFYRPGPQSGRCPRDQRAGPD